MTETTSIAIFTRAALMLAEADTIQKAKELKSLALTAADWAKRKGMGEEAILHCRSYALEAERKLGEMLAGTERARPAIGSKVIGNQRLPMKDERPTLKDFGLKKRDSAEAQLLASIPAPTFEALKAGKTTRADIKRDIRKQQHARRVEAAASNPKESPKGPFEIILADPSWQYSISQTPERELDNHYGTRELKDIIGDAPNAAKRSALFLWATPPLLREALTVMKEWHFEYKAHAIWNKELIGLGYWFRNQHELLLLGVRGDFEKPPESERVSSIFTERRRAHSQKPECVYVWIERAFPLASKLEMYARTPRKGWAQHGNEL